MGTPARGTALKISDMEAIPAFTAVGRLTSIGGPKSTWEELDITAHDSPGNDAEFVLTRKSYADLPFSGQFKPGDAGQVDMQAAHDAGTAFDFQIVWPAGIGKTASFEAFVKEYGTDEAAVDGVVPFSGVLKITGPVTVANTV